ncbi:hypothetical protein [Paenibacillus sp. IHBB 3054]
MSRKITKGIAPLEEIAQSTNEDGFIEIVDDADIVELVMMEDYEWNN